MHIPYIYISLYTHMYIYISYHPISLFRAKDWIQRNPLGTWMLLSPTWRWRWLGPAMWVPSFWSKKHPSGKVVGKNGLEIPGNQAEMYINVYLPSWELTYIPSQDNFEDDFFPFGGICTRSPTTYFTYFTLSRCFFAPFLPYQKFKLNNRHPGPPLEVRYLDPTKHTQKTSGGGPGCLGWALLVSILFGCLSALQKQPSPPPSQEISDPWILEDFGQLMSQIHQKYSLGIQSPPESGNGT